MKQNKMIQTISIVLMLLGLFFMVVSWIKTDNINYVMGGLVFVSICGLIPSILNSK